MRRNFDDLTRPPRPESASPAVVLLDEEQQRALQRSRAAAPSLRWLGSGSIGADSLGHDSFGAESLSMSSPPRRPEPRTDFTSARSSPRTDFTGRRYQNLTTGSGGTWRSGEDRPTASSSPRTNFTTRHGGRFSDDDDFSPGILRGDYPSDCAPAANPFMTITERTSVDSVEAFQGSRSTLRLSVVHILIGAVIGLALGILFATVKVSTLTANWIALPGDLFLRALKSLVVPYVFCSVAVAIGDLVHVGKVSAIGLQTFKVFFTEWVTGSAAGLAIAIAFRPLFRLDTAYTVEAENAVGLVCPDASPLGVHANGSVSCGLHNNSADLANSTLFVVDDLFSTFKKNADAALTNYTLSEQLQSMLNSIVPTNVFASMGGTAELLSVITFAMALGALAGRGFFTKTRRVNYLYMMLLQLRDTFFLATEWVIWLTPVAVISILAGSFATNQTSVSQLADVYMYLVANVCGMLVQTLLVFPTVLFAFTRCNPFAHMQLMARSYAFAFGSSSSLATAPVTLGCIQRARVCSQSLANFVISIGVVTNMAGAGFYYPIGVIFLAESSGAGDQLTPAKLLAVYFLTVLACAATPPVPSSGQVVMATIYRTVMGGKDLPSTWALYVAMDFFADRLSTVCNVNDDIMALKVIAETTDETVAGDHLGRRD